jgi:hypothetical protein
MPGTLTSAQVRSCSYILIALTIEENSRVLPAYDIVSSMKVDSASRLWEIIDVRRYSVSLQFIVIFFTAFPIHFSRHFFGVVVIPIILAKFNPDQRSSFLTSFCNTKKIQKLLYAITKQEFLRRQHLRHERVRSVDITGAWKHAFANRSCSADILVSNL